METEGNKVRWLGHACFQITSGDGRIIIIDPWLTDNPTAACAANDITKADFVLVTHDHNDHIGDAARIVKETGAALISARETAIRLQQEAGIPGSQLVFGMGMNIGGSATLNGITITMTQAFHSSHTANPVGYIIRLENGFAIYHAGDTGIFSSMKLFGEFYNIDLALLPIGGVFTMGPEQASMAARLLGVSTVIPMHYKTFPMLEQDASSFKKIMAQEAPEIKVVILEPGQEYVL